VPPGLPCPSLTLLSGASLSPKTRTETPCRDGISAPEKKTKVPLPAPGKNEIHSYRRTSTGSSFAAARAGTSVATTEIPSDTAVIQTPSARLG
jgi:hypothetical protein